MTSDSNIADAASLCLDCGLCCNGVMFDRVMLQPGDNPKALSAYGLKIKRREYFPQPCIALCGTLCTMYQHRPTRCRLFECQQYKEVTEGSTSAQQALDLIAEVKRQVVVIESMLEGLTANNPRKSLAQRCANALVELPEESQRREDLTAASNELQALLAERFRIT